MKVRTAWLAVKSAFFIVLFAILALVTVIGWGVSYHSGVAIPLWAALSSLALSISVGAVVLLAIRRAHSTAPPTLEGVLGARLRVATKRLLSQVCNI